jgi:hypothetical protein
MMAAITSSTSGRVNPMAVTSARGNAAKAAKLRVRATELNATRAKWPRMFDRSVSFRRWRHTSGVTDMNPTSERRKTSWTAG